MGLRNHEIADQFDKLANFLEIEGESPFRIRAYRNASRTLRNLSKEVGDLLAQGTDLSDLPGIGRDLAEKITTLAKTGKFPLLAKIQKRLPEALNDLMNIEGLGPKRIQLIYHHLKPKTIHELETAIQQGRLQGLPGFGEKTVKKIQQGITHLLHEARRWPLADVLPTVKAVVAYLSQIKGVSHVECAGSVRRRKETVGDLDVLAVAAESQHIMSKFVQFEEVAKVLAQGSTRSTVRLRSGIQIDLRVVTKKSFGAALVYFTGSKEHNIAIRKIALQQKHKINEYGVFDQSGDYIAGRSEKEVYRHIGLSYIEPELREDRGEIEAARKGGLPTLITREMVRGDLHCHTDASDGTGGLETMAMAAIKQGHEYLAITDHSHHLAMIKGLDKHKAFRQIKAIDQLNAKLKGLVILKSIEVDILEDGALDLPNEVLKELDLTVCSIHSKFNLSKAKQTERIIRAMDNPYFTILAHPTGRLINKRAPYEVDIERVMLAAKERGCILELNAQPKRLDLDDRHGKMAKELGTKVAISSDAHSPEQLGLLQYGIYQARRAWLEKDDVINARPLKELRKFLRR